MSGRFITCLCSLCGLLLATNESWAAPGENVHYRYRLSNTAPGEVGGSQLERGGPLPGYYQPVEIRVPRGAQVSMVVDDRFQKETPTPVVAGMLIGQVYRFRVTGIPLNEGREVFPTIEVVNRLYPPPGQETRFPIPVELTKEELEYALNGRFVTRVIYLEDPQTAIANRQGPDKAQPYYTVAPSEDPLQVADTVGRPMAILRIGSRVPDEHVDMHRFSYGSPPFIQFAATALPVGRQAIPPSVPANKAAPAAVPEKPTAPPAAKS